MQTFTRAHFARTASATRCLRRPAGVLRRCPSGRRITLIGVGSLPGNATDLSGLGGSYTAPAGTTPANQLGACGSIAPSAQEKGVP